MKKTKTKNIEELSFADRIEEIKARISSCDSTPAVCKVEVYETWQNIFEE